MQLFYEQIFYQNLCLLRDTIVMFLINIPATKSGEVWLTTGYIKSYTMNASNKYIKTKFQARQHISDI